MVGRRIVTLTGLTGLAGVLVLVASTGTSWAHPGNGHRHAYGHTNAAAHGHKSHGHQTNGTLLPPTGPDTTQPPVTNAVRSTSETSGHGHAWGHAHAGLASHPGKALGLYKHADQSGNPVGQQHNSAPPPTTSTGAGEPPTSTVNFQQPAQQPPTTEPGDHSGPPPSTGPPTQPPTKQPPIAKGPAALAQVWLHSNPVRFTALPLVIISVMALGVCGLIGLARHRA